MPLYTYRCPEGHEREVIHGMTEDPEVLCESPVGTCACCGVSCNGCYRPMQRVIRVAPAVSTRRFDMADGYQAHLARFPNDPQAHTGGQISKRKLIDQRLREGWREMGRVDDQKLDGKASHLRGVSAIDVARAKVREGKVDFDE